MPRQNVQSRSRWVAGLAGLVLIAITGGCASNEDGTLQFEDQGLIYCGLTELGQFGVGIDLERESGGPITIDEVTSSRQDGLRIIGAVLVDRPGGGVATSKWPLSGKWPGKREAVGAVVPSGKEVGLVVGVRRMRDDGGSLGTIVIRYTEGDREYVTDTYSTIEMSASC
ncbi:MULTISPECIES: hypothetical protein [unclassified Curtobacterium]|uniref:hypothetical protein n=1 Tax=unclassified Curtobacterium TaxID=257496 RepID=UPI0008DCB56F|nr:MULTISPECIES: hypothetical protein [unclassified Curtobacterium]OIH99652.1 hypothetical protein BIU92_01860 [Curtobacterium sp. MCBA15_003]OII30513.1 hypothetical protein BIU94_07035 [Curtobacterium sp. MMLR14_006]